MADRFDYIICGGGSAGCVLASRLSARPEIRVLLIEAGPDFEPGTEPPGLRDRGVRAFMLRSYFWERMVHEVGAARIPYLSPRVMGGGSSINGMHAQRGLPRDYDEWARLKVRGWNWQDVLPYFMKLETDIDFSGELHGKNGPITISRVPERDWSPLTKALHQSLKGEGLRDLRDFNIETGDGMAPTPLNNDAQARVSSAMAYLTPTVRARKNLAIRPNTVVRKIVFDNARARGVEIEGESIDAGEVIVCGGAIHSPAVLMRSGIGPGGVLQECGIDAVAVRDGVGGNLANHPFFSITCHVSPAGRQHGFRRVRQPVPMIVRYSSKQAGCEDTDMVLNLWERLPGPLANDPLGRQLAQMMVLLNKSHSRGAVSLDPAAPFGPPKIRANILKDDDDAARMVDAFKFVSRLLLSPPLSQYADHCFIDKTALGKPPAPMTLKLLQDTRRARMLSTTASFAMDYVPGVRARILRDSGPSVASLLAEPERLPDILRMISYPGGHPMGTCRMGDADDAKAVTDSRCRVIGVDGLRVVDASIFPSPMTAGTNLPVMMAAEKVADMLMEDRHSGVRAREVDLA